MSARQYVTAEYVRANIVGYDASGQSDETFKRMLERDKNELRELGIPVVTGRNGVGAEGYLIKPDDYALPDIRLETEEAAAVAAAAAVWRVPDLAAVSQSAVLKLRAAGVDVVAPDELGVEHAGGPRSVGSETAIRGLIDAIGAAQAVTFTHRSTRGRSTRRVEPWGVVGNRGRWYVIGHDLDRDATRTFRTSRIDDVAPASDRGAVHVPAGLDLNALVDEAVSRANDAQNLTARVWLAQGRAHGLRRMARSVTSQPLGSEDGDVAEIDVRSRVGVIRAVLSAGADAVVLEPADLRATVIAELDCLAAGQGGTR
ncbi:WYL domain-containing protein [Gordonia sp. HY285]|uniref:helix-turn-helix transcriptional regulator n=1 Tax=Gordonia liuliyuniae TaxID=2911517 RepID=UPI001F356A92|nr:WYL domain-containing protein [Gordonia liuliyuniae]MCF8610598.1 WYL domain-containing protein [Gordonia liuliyuniae]